MLTIIAIQKTIAELNFLDSEENSRILRDMNSALAHWEMKWESPLKHHQGASMADENSTDSPSSRGINKNNRINCGHGELQ